MTTYRTGRPSGVTIVRDGVPYSAQEGNPPAEDDELVAVVVNGDRELAERICALLNADETFRAGGLLEFSVTPACTCGTGVPDPACPVHEGRRARGPKPPPVGPGCGCDGSGRTCPRHGAVI